MIRDFIDGRGAGVVTAADTASLGCSPDVVQAMVRSKELVRVAKGTYVRATALDPPRDSPHRMTMFALAEHRHRLRLDALLRRFGEDVAASHQSAVLVWGLPTRASSLDRVHLMHLKRGKTARLRESYTLHTCRLENIVSVHEDRRVVVPALAVIGQAMTVGVVAGVQAMDAAIRRKLTTRAELEGMLTKLRHTPRLAHGRRAVDLADGLAESPGETDLRMILIDLGVAFIAQHWIRIDGSATYYRVDFYLPELGVILEYDGTVKYGNAGGPVEGRAGTGQAALAREKEREDDLRGEGFGVGRVTSRTLSSTAVARIIASAQRQALPRARNRAAERPHWASD